MTDLSLLHQFVDPWYASMQDPAESQALALEKVLQGYANTEYGKSHGAKDVDGISDYRSHFPVTTYQNLTPYIAKVAKGDYSALLPEPVRRWVMTRGTTGASKVLPVGETHLSEILSYGARAVVNFAITRNSDVLDTPVLNLNFPSEVHEMSSSGGEVSYGYSSGTYAKLNPELMGARLLPRQQEIDSLGSGIKRKDWEARFELAFQRAKDSDIGSLMGVTPVMIAFGKFLRRRHSVRPGDVWKPRALFCTSVAKIQTRYAPILQRLFGASPVVEMYAATEGAFAQQKDSLPYVSPNYDGYVFEAMVEGKIKMLHEMRATEWGRLIVSTSVLPRYDIGDLIEAAGKGYFRVFGRNRPLVRAEHSLFNFVTLRF